jgi:hypothetical protein
MTSQNVLLFPSNKTRALPCQLKAGLTIDKGTHSMSVDRLLTNKKSKQHVHQTNQISNHNSIALNKQSLETEQSSQLSTATLAATWDMVTTVVYF